MPCVRPRAEAPCTCVVQVRGKSEVQIAARDAIGHMDYLRERLNSSQEAIEACLH